MRLSLPGSVSSVMVRVGVGILRLLGWSVFRGNIQIFIFSCHCHPSLTTSKVNTPRQLYLNQDFFSKRKSHLAVQYLSFLSLSYPGSQYWVNHQTEISNIGSLLLSFSSRDIFFRKVLREVSLRSFFSANYVSDYLERYRADWDEIFSRGGTRDSLFCLQSVFLAVKWSDFQQSCGHHH